MSQAGQDPSATLREIVTAAPACLDSGARLSDALARMRGQGIGSVLIRRGAGDGVAGILTVRDLVAAAARGVSLDRPATELMSHPVAALPAATPLGEAYGRMRRMGIRHLLVTGADEAPLGIVGETDFFNHLTPEQLLRSCSVLDVMDEEVPRLTPEASAAELLAALAGAPGGCVAVTRGAVPLAILTEQDVLGRLSAEREDERVADYLEGLEAPRTIGAAATLPQARVALECAAVRHLAVLDDDGSLLGVLSQRGLIAAGLPARSPASGLDHPLRIRLRQFQRAVQQSPVSVIVTDTEGTIEYVNPRFCEMTGYTAREILGQNPRVLKSGDQTADYYRNLWRAISNGQVWRGQLCNRRKDGSPYRASATIAPIRDDAGRIVNFVGIQEDITEQLRIAEAQRESEANYRSLVESLSGEYVLYRLDRDGRWIYLSPSIERLLGYRPDELIGRCDPRLSAHPVNAQRPQTLEIVFAGRRPEPYEIEVLDKSGEPRRLRISEVPVWGRDGQVAALQGIAQDITEHHLARVLLDGRHRVLERLARGRPLGEVLDALTDNIREADPEVVPAVHILDEDGTRLLVVSAAGLPSHYNRAIDGLQIGDGVGACGTAIVRNTLVVCDDILSDPDWAPFRDLVLSTDLRACWAHPIRGRDGRVLGTFAMYYRTPRRPRTRELKLIESAADLASVVLEHAHAEAALQRAEERERLLLESATEGILGVTADGTATFVNPAAARMLGYEHEELCGMDVRGLSGLPGAAPDRTPGMTEDLQAQTGLLVATARDGHPRHLVGEILHRRDGRGFPVELWSNPVLHRGELVGSVVTFRDISERLEHEQRIRFLAFHDALTGLPNRNLLRESIERELSRLRRHSAAFALFLIDLDHFKDVNDSLGHPAGDELLQVVAERLRAEVRPEDGVARMGGDEFAVVQSHVRDRDGVLGLAHRLVDALAKPVVLRGRKVTVGASVGVVLVDELADADTLIARADLALYQAKDQGRNCFALFHLDMAVALERELAIVGSLPEAIAKGWLQLLYQPLVRIPGGRLYGVEALVRWRHPRLGELMPGDFVPVLERRGAIARLDGWVLARAAQQSRDWATRGLPFGRLAVNLSTLHPDDGQGSGGPAELVRRQGGDPRALELELTERLLTRKGREVTDSIANLQAAGMGIAIDDFGTGYASLSYIRRFSPRTLKIDRALIAGMLEDRGDAEIVKAAIALGRALGLALVAEGVEESAQTDFLIAHGCRLAQGYAFGAPMEAEALERAFLGPARIP